VLDDVTFELGEGVTGLLGPNGAGKTTLLSLVATVLQGGSGQIEVGGHDVRTRHGRLAARRLLGFLPQRFDLSGGMSLQDTVAYAGWSWGLGKGEVGAAAVRALRVVGLEDRASQRVRVLSGGQRQRLGIAAAIVHDPRVLILDEPTVGLDPAQRLRTREYLQEIGRERTVLLSTHLIEDVSRLCERIVVLSEGRVRYHGDTAALIAGSAEDANPLISPLEAGYERLLTSSDPEGAPWGG
jgi:ABC-2 type transport system ATP-binding protein